VHARELGYAVIDLAALLGVREETVSRWCSRYDQGGQGALPRDRTGRPIGSGRLLNGGQEQGIQQAIETKTPQALEIPSALWTRQAVQELIHQQVGLRLPIRTVGEYLRRWGYTPTAVNMRRSSNVTSLVTEDSILRPRRLCWSCPPSSTPLSKAPRPLS
jgi:transposase